MQNNNTGRAAGVLCHISSLWGNYGIGSLGKEAYEFADFLKSTHVKYWQILPLVQTGYGNSPYSSVCCSSGNPYFIDLEDLAAQGLLKRSWKVAKLSAVTSITIICIIPDTKRLKPLFRGLINTARSL